MKNFTNGALVFRIWKFDGTGEILSKHQYSSDAEDFAYMKAKDDGIKRSDSDKWFYLVACEYENSVKAFFPQRPIAEVTI